MSRYPVPVIGPDSANPTVEGFAMGYRHAEAYRDNNHCRLLACTNIVRDVIRLSSIGGITGESAEFAL